MIALVLALYSFFLIGWDIWDLEAVNPFSSFTQAGLGCVLAQTHPVLWVSLGLLLFSKKVKWMPLVSMALALTPSVIGPHPVDIGLGSFLYLLCSLWMLGKNFRDSFSASALLVLSSLILLFIVIPMGSILKTAHWASLTLLPSVYWNTFQLAVVVSLISTLIALSLALVAARSRHLRLKKIFKGFSLLPMITPPFVIGLSLIFLFGRAGFVTNQLLGLEQNYLIGFPGLVLTQVLAFTPLSFMVILSVLEGIDPTLEEASQVCRAAPWQTFRRVTWKLLKPGLANAFLLTMIESFADFANPIVVGGDYHVLSTEIYFSVIGKYDEHSAAALALVLLGSTLAFFLLQRLWLGRKSYVSITGKPQGRVTPGLPPMLDKTLTVFSWGWIGLTLALYLFFFYGGFVALWGVDHHLTLDHYRQFLIDGLDSFWTTMALAAVSAPLTAIAGLLLAYCIERKKFFGKGVLEFTSLLAFAVPGTVVGIGYLLAFHDSPLPLGGTAFILIFCFVFRNMSVGQRAGQALFSQMDASLEEASYTLRADTQTTLRRILLPLAEGAVITALTTSFIRSVTAISAVVFLVSAQYNLATKVILDRIEYGRLGVATAYFTILVVCLMVMMWVSHWGVQALSGRQHRKLEEPAIPLGKSYA